MTHLPYIVAAYGIALVLVAFYAIGAWVRIGQARRRLAAIDRRGRG